MPASSSPPSPDGSPLSEDDRRALVRFLEQSLDHGFRLAIVEAVNHADREAILAVAAATIGPGLLRVAVDELPGSETNLWTALREPFDAHAPRCLALWGFENSPRSDWPGQLNVQRDLFVRDFAVPWLLFIHPASRVPLLQAAPDFCDFAVLWLRDELPAAEMVLSAPIQTRDSPLSSRLILRDPLLREIRDELEAARYDVARDLLARFDLQPDHDLFDRVYRHLFGAQLERERGRFGAAEATLRDIRNSLARQPLTPDTQVFLQQIDTELGLLLSRSGRYSEAEALLRRSLAFFENTVGREHPAYTISLNHLAGVLLARGEIVEAERLLREALAVDLKLPGSERLLLGSTLHELALALRLRGEYAEAERLLCDALAIKEKELGREHLSYGASLHALAGVLTLQGKLEEAERLSRESVAIAENALGRRHPSYGAALNNLAGVLARQGNFHEAERLQRECLSIIEVTLGREHPDYSTSLHSLATLLAHQGEYTEAERLFRESIAIDEKALGSEHPSYGASLHSLASVLSRQGKYAEAERVFRRSISSKEKVLGREHPSLIRTLAELGLVEANQGRTDDGILNLERALRIGRAGLGGENPDVRRAQEMLRQVQALK